MAKKKDSLKEFLDIISPIFVGLAFGLPVFVTYSDVQFIYLIGLFWGVWGWVLLLQLSHNINKKEDEK